MVKKQVLAAVAIISVVALVIAGVAIAASLLVVQSPPSDEVTPLAPNYLLSKISVNSTTPLLNEDTVLLSTTLTPTVAGVEVFFYRLTPTNMLLGSSLTDANGVATYNTGPFSSTVPKTFIANCTINIP